MSEKTSAAVPQADKVWTTEAEWFAGGQRLWYDVKRAGVLTDDRVAGGPGVPKVFERAPTPPVDANAVWLTMLPGFPDGSYGWAQVDRLLPAGLGPRLYVEPVGQGDSDKHRRNAKRWDFAAIARELHGAIPLYVGGSDEDPYEHRQITATRERVPEAQVLTFPGGHLTTSEHPDLLAAAVFDIASRHGVTALPDVAHPTKELA